MAAEQPWSYEHGTPISEPSIFIEPRSNQSSSVCHVTTIRHAFEDKIYKVIVLSLQGYQKKYYM